MEYLRIYTFLFLIRQSLDGFEEARTPQASVGGFAGRRFNLPPKLSYKAVLEYASDEPSFDGTPQKYYSRESNSYSALRRRLSFIQLPLVISIGDDYHLMRTRGRKDIRAMQHH